MCSSTSERKGVTIHLMLSVARRKRGTVRIKKNNPTEGRKKGGESYEKKGIVENTRRALAKKRSPQQNTWLVRCFHDPKDEKGRKHKGSKETISSLRIGDSYKRDGVEKIGKTTTSFS